MRFHIKCFLNGKKVSELATGKRMRVVRFPVPKVLSEWTLKVQYQKGVHNEGTFKTKKELLDTLRVWTDKDLIKYATSGSW